MSDLPPDVVNIDVARKKKAARVKIAATSTDMSLPLIRIVASEIPRAVDAAEQVLLRSDMQVYQNGDRVVTVGWREVPATNGELTQMLTMIPVDEAYMFECFSRVARFEKLDLRAGAYVLCDLPDKAVKVYLSKGHKKKLPVLLGVVNAPCFRPDGSLITEKGYDKRTRLYYDDLGVKFPEVPEMPAHADAVKALKTIKHLLREYKFASDKDRSVALSTLITPLVRPMLPSSPIHTIDATTPGSGKTKIGTMACIIRTGRNPYVITDDDKGEGELDKRVVARAIAGDPFIFLNNITTVISSSMLGDLAIEPQPVLRVLGLSKDVEISNVTSIVITGNNVQIDGDLPRRNLTCRIKPESAHPELLKFMFDPVTLCARARPMLVSKILTIIRAYRQTKHKVDRNKYPPLGSFEVWCKTVREALLWCGEADPCEIDKRTERLPLKILRVLAIIYGWRTVVGIGRRVTCGLVTEMAQRDYGYGIPGNELDGQKTMSDAEITEDNERRNIFKGALISVAASGSDKGNVSAERLGRWLCSVEGRQFSDENGRVFAFERGPLVNGCATWSLSEIFPTR
jgi:putative DNA primase/helicase